MIYESIYELHKKYNISVHRTTELLGINESAYYNWVRSGKMIENNDSVKLFNNKSETKERNKKELSIGRVFFLRNPRIESYYFFKTIIKIYINCFIIKSYIS